jgi:hypothetical protein
VISIFHGKAGVSRPGRKSPPETCWRRARSRLSLATGPDSRPAATKESVMYLQPLLARVLLATVSILLVLAGLAEVAH